MAKEFRDLQFVSFNILESGISVRVDSRENFSEWHEFLLDIAKMPQQIPICFAGAWQLFMRLSQDREKYRDEYAIVNAPPFRETITTAGFHIELRQNEIEFFEQEKDMAVSADSPVLREHLEAIQSWLVTDPNDAIKKLTIENHETIKTVVRNRLSK